METLSPVSLVLLSLLLAQTGAAPMNTTMSGPTRMVGGGGGGGGGGHGGGGHGGGGHGIGGHGGMANPYNMYHKGYCSYLLDYQHLLGGYLPVCDMYGYFTPVQCFLDYCWCVDTYSGYPLLHTLTPVGTDLHCVDYYCPPGWTYYNRRCFMFVDSPKPWVEAEGYCRYEEGNLASIHSYEEGYFIKGLTRGDSYNFPETWVGGHDAIKDCVWMWTDGTKFHYDDFYKNMSSSPKDTCLKINYGCDWKWCSADCSAALPFVCAKKMSYM